MFQHKYAAKNILANKVHEVNLLMIMLEKRT